MERKFEIIQEITALVREFHEIKNKKEDCLFFCASLGDSTVVDKEGDLAIKNKNTCGFVGHPLEVVKALGLLAIGSPEVEEILKNVGVNLILNKEGFTKNRTIENIQKDEK